MSVPTNTERLMMIAEMHCESARDMTLDARLDEALVQWLEAAKLYDEAGATAFQHDVLVNAGKLAEQLGQTRRACELFTHAVELVRAPGSEQELGITLAHLSRTSIALGLVAEGVAYAHEAMDIGERHDEPALVGATGLTMAQLELGRGDVAAAEQNLARAQRGFELSDNATGLGHVANQRGEIARARDDLGAAHEHFRDAMRAFMERRDVRGLGLVLANQGNLARMQGDLENAQSLFQASYEMAVLNGDHAGIARALTNIGNVAAARGDIDVARKSYEKALAMDKKRGHAQAVIGGLVNLASLAATEGRLGEARDAYVEALDALRPLRSARTSADVLAMIGQLEARMGHLAEAERRFAEARAAALQASHALGLARLDINDAAMIYARGDVTRALAAYRAAAPRLEAVGGASDLATLWLVVSDAALVSGDLDGAQAALDAATTRLAGDAREQLDIAVTRARIALGRGESSGELFALADQLASTRPIDALVARLAALENGPTPDDATLAEGLHHEAERLALAPLRIEATSVWLAAAGGDPRRAEALIDEADRLELGLLSIRARRRLAVTRARAGDAEGAERARTDALARARAAGAALEVARLEAMV